MMKILTALTLMTAFTSVQAAEEVYANCQILSRPNRLFETFRVTSSRPSYERYIATSDRSGFEIKATYSEGSVHVSNYHYDSANHVDGSEVVINAQNVQGVADAGDLRTTTTLKVYCRYAGE